MAQKRYTLSTAAQNATQMHSSGAYKMRCRFLSSEGINVAPKNGPLFTLTDLTWVVGTANAGAQDYLEKALLPKLFGGTGETIWTDVTGSTTPGDVDLDLDPSFS